MRAKETVLLACQCRYEGMGVRRSTAGGLSASVSLEQLCSHFLVKHCQRQAKNCCSVLASSDLMEKEDGSVISAGSCFRILEIVWSALTQTS